MKDVYTVIKTSNLAANETIEDLITKVNDSIKDGWKPQGGVSAVLTPSGPQFYQAMIKDWFPNQ